MNKLDLKNNIPILSLAIIFIIDFLLIVSTHHNWNYSMQKYIPLKTQIENIKSEITLGHLWIEERISGDKTVSINRDIILNLSHYDFKEYLKEAKTIFEGDEKEVYERLLVIDKKGEEFLSLAKTRLQNEKEHKIGSVLDQEFDRKFAHIISMIVGLNYSIDEKIKQELYNKQNVFIFVIFLFLSANFLVFLFLYKYRVKNVEIQKSLDIQKERSKEKEKLLIQQSKMAAMGEMIENIVHQWRQPLSLIATTSSGLKLKKELNMLEDKELNDSLDLISDSTIHLSKTIDDFRGFFNPNKPKDIFSIQDSCEKTLAFVASKLKNRGIEVIKNLQDIKFEGFENEFVQVLMILINNSIYALENRIDKKVILIENFIKDNKINLVIHDSAGGICESIKEQVFDAYFTTKDSSGTGIGLYMADEIISKHMQGQISFENKDFDFNNNSLHGASFLIKLPLKCNI